MVHKLVQHFLQGKQERVCSQVCFSMLGKHSTAHTAQQLWSIVVYAYMAFGRRQGLKAVHRETLEAWKQHPSAPMRARLGAPSAA